MAGVRHSILLFFMFLEHYMNTFPSSVRQGFSQCSCFNYALSSFFFFHSSKSFLYSFSSLIWALFVSAFTDFQSDGFNDMTATALPLFLAGCQLPNDSFSFVPMLKLRSIFFGILIWLLLSILFLDTGSSLIYYRSSKQSSSR